MAAQEFLASFAVEIDEAGVSKLQKILQENAALADSVATAFSSAASAIESFFSDSDFSSLLDTDQGLEITVDLSSAELDLQSFRQEAEIPIEIAVDATAISTEGEAALSELRTVAAKPVEIAADASKIETEGKKALASVKTEAAKPIPIAADASKISSEGSKALASVKTEAAKPIPIAADASDITTKGNAALSSLKSAATTPIPLYGDASNLQSAGTNAINQIKLAARTPIVFSANFPAFCSPLEPPSSKSSRSLPRRSPSLSKQPRQIIRALMAGAVVTAAMALLIAPQGIIPLLKAK